MKTHKSILNSQPKKLAKQFHLMIDDLKDAERKGSLALSIVCALHDVAVCDYCQDEWFTYGKSGHFVKGDKNGLLILGVSCCKFCLDEMFAESVDLDEDEYQSMAQDLGHWLAMFSYKIPENLTHGIRMDDHVQKHYKLARSQ